MNQGADAGVVIARFSKRRAAVLALPPLLLGLALAAASIALLIWLLTPDHLPSRRHASVILLLGGFALAALICGGRNLTLLAHHGTAISVCGGVLTAFTGRFVPIPLAELSRVSISGSRVNVHDTHGRALAIRSDITDLDAREVAAAIRALL